MQIITQGYEITGVPGVAKIIIRPNITESMSYPEITIDAVDEDGDPTSILDFDLDGLRAFEIAIIKAVQLAEQIENQLDSK